MIVEMLRITCPLEKREAFLKRDAEVWTRGLQTQPGFLGKEAWVNPAKPDELVLVIHMESLAHLRAIPQTWIDQIEADMGEYKMPEVSEIFEVHAPDPRYRQSSS